MDCDRDPSFLWFSFAIDQTRCVTAIPQDDDIDRSLWLSAESIFSFNQLRSPLVAESLRCYQRGEAG